MCDTQLLPLCCALTSLHRVRLIQLNAFFTTLILYRVSQKERFWIQIIYYGSKLGCHCFWDSLYNPITVSYISFCMIIGNWFRLEISRLRVGGWNTNFTDIHSDVFGLIFNDFGTFYFLNNMFVNRHSDFDLILF